ncbi:MAG: efflux RND transporter periplasmic adaptor subunit [Coleofasciculaceae cyanobacterium]
MIELQGKKKLKTGVQWLVWSGVLALVGAGGWLVFVKAGKNSADPVPVRLIKVERGNVETTINESGTLKLYGQQTLTSPDESAVDQVLVKVGDRVREGQPLVTLRNPEQQANLTARQLEIQSKEQTLARNQEKVYEAEKKLAAVQRELQLDQSIAIQKQELTIERSQEKVAEAKEKLEAEQQELEELEKLAERGFIPANELRSQQEQIRSAESGLREAESNISAAVLELENIKQQRQNSETELSNKILSTQAELREAQLTVGNDKRELQRLRLDLQKTQQQVKNNVVTAPIDGQILDILVKNGDGVTRGKELITLGDPEQELVSLRLSTLNAAQVEPNQEARVSIIGPDSQVYEGRVDSLSPQANTSTSGEGGQQSSQAGQATVPATVRLLQPTETLIPGSRVNVEIVLEQRQDVVAIDTEVIQRSAPEPFVWIPNLEGKAQKQPVTLGLEGLTTVEVTSGLQEGDQVAIPPPQTPLQPGTPLIKLETGMDNRELKIEN